MKKIIFYGIMLIALVSVVLGGGRQLYYHMENGDVKINDSFICFGTSCINSSGEGGGGTDDQTLSYTPATGELSIEDGNSVYISYDNDTICRTYDLATLIANDTIVRNENYVAGNDSWNESAARDIFVVEESDPIFIGENGSTIKYYNTSWVQGIIDSYVDQSFVEGLNFLIKSTIYALIDGNFSQVSGRIDNLNISIQDQNHSINNNTANITDIRNSLNNAGNSSWNESAARDIFLTLEDQRYNNSDINNSDNINDLFTRDLETDLYNTSQEIFNVVQNGTFCYVDDCGDSYDDSDLIANVTELQNNISSIGNWTNDKEDYYTTTSTDGLLSDINSTIQSNNDSITSVFSDVVFSYNTSWLDDYITQAFIENLGFTISTTIKEWINGNFTANSERIDTLNTTLQAVNNSDNINDLFTRDLETDLYNESGDIIRAIDTAMSNNITDVNTSMKAYVDDQSFLTSETDPTFDTLTSGKWCIYDGDSVDCDQDEPLGGGGSGASKWVDTGDYISANASFGSKVNASEFTVDYLVNVTEHGVFANYLQGDLGWNNLSNVPAGLDDGDNDRNIDIDQNVNTTGMPSYLNITINDTGYLIANSSCFTIGNSVSGNTLTIC